MNGVTAGKNDSGFHGFTLATLYPGMATGVTQSLDTVPEPEEQATYTQVDQPAPPAVDPKQKTNIWMLLGGLVLLVVLFGKAG